MIKLILSVEGLLQVEQVVEVLLKLRVFLLLPELSISIKRSLV
jgi:hypothetical protein